MEAFPSYNIVRNHPLLILNWIKMSPFSTIAYFRPVAKENAIP